MNELSESPVYDKDLEPIPYPIVYEKYEELRQDQEAYEIFIPSLIAILIIPVILSLFIKSIELFLPIKKTSFITVYLLLVANTMIGIMFYLMVTFNFN